MTHRLLYISIGTLPLLLSVACGAKDLTVGDKNPPLSAGGSDSSAGGASGDNLPGDKMPGGVPPDKKGDPSGGSDAAAGAPADPMDPGMKPGMTPQASFICSDMQMTIIAFSLVCNGMKDCPDGSDEVNCPGSFWLCKDGGQIDPQLFCDGKPDCKDGSDELDCLPAADTFVCKDGGKIPKMFVCTGKPECGDGSDELGCTFMCIDGSDSASRFDPMQKCWQAAEVIGCATMLDPALSVPKKWPNTSCLHRKMDDALFTVSRPELATDWLECTPTELMLTGLAKPCP